MVYAIPIYELRSTPAFGRRRRLPLAAAAMLIIMKSLSVFSFGDKMLVDVHKFIHLTGKSIRDMFLKTTNRFTKWIFVFCCMVEGCNIQEWDSKRGLFLVLCILTILFKAVKTKSQSFLLPSKMTQVNYQSFLCETHQIFIEVGKLWSFTMMKLWWEASSNMIE